MYLENMNNQLNVRKSLKSDAATNGVGLNTVARKTLMHSMKEQNGIETKNVGFQNSMFSLENVEDHLARLGRIHMILEHLILIQSHLKLENGNVKTMQFYWPMDDLSNIFRILPYQF